MTLEAAVKTALSGGPVGDRVYPATFPQDCLWPAIRFVFISSDYEQDICGDGGDETADHRIQVDGVAPTYDGMRAVRALILSRMAAMSPPARAAGAFEDYESDEKRHRCMLEFVVAPSSIA